MLIPKEEPTMTALLIASAIALMIFASRRAALRLQERSVPVRVTTRTRR
jgi:NADH:ubiquinone oxidoreductase subunit H